jgi:hypothetical protein
MKDLKQFIKTTIREFLIENQNKSDNTNLLKSHYIKNGFTGEDILNMSDEGYFNNIEWVDNNTLIVYRSLSLPKNKINDFLKSAVNGIGQYWSFNKDIESIWGSNTEYEYPNEDIVDIRCKGHLKLKDIDFEDLLYAYSDDFHHFCDEQEIKGKLGGNKIKVVDCQIY